MSIAIFSEGCFWGVESIFRKINGVSNVTVGYTGGHLDNPTYENICAGGTGHAEAVKIDFDENKVTYEELLDVFWSTHNPTTLNRQGPDIGDQYRSAIFYTNSEQKDLAEKTKHILEEKGSFDDKKIVTEITEATKFYPAEEYHQRYFEKKGINPTCHV